MADPTGIHLSVLDIAPVWRGSTQAQALRDTLALAPEVERLGYRRYWVAEHHNTPSIASSSPPMLAGQIAARTSTIGIGSGGVLLPNHPPLVIAEQFGLLEALYPGRVDLGLGRASGTDPLTAGALRRNAFPQTDFTEQIDELEVYFADPRPGGPEPAVMAVPAQGNRPRIWMLGSSPASARLAAARGMPYAFAHHIAPDLAVTALRLYRQEFRPSPVLDRPYAVIAASVIVADTDERARWLIRPMTITGIELRTTGRSGPLYPPSQAAEYRFSPMEQDMAAQSVGRHLVGSPGTVAGLVSELLSETGADELMALTNVHDPAERLRSFELLAGIVPLVAPASAEAGTV